MPGATAPHLLLIALGGALGAVGRYLVVAWVGSRLGIQFPWGTMTVNVLGSLLLGILFVLVVERLDSHAEMKSLIMVGFLGAFTTFSTFALESWHLLAGRQVMEALVYMGASVFVCVLAAGAGIYLGRQLLLP